MFNPVAFVDNLKYLGEGMLGVFVVIGMVIAVTYLLNWVFSDRKSGKKNKQ